MIDTGKILKGLKCCHGLKDGKRTCNCCPYWCNNAICQTYLIEDVYDMLNGQKENLSPFDVLDIISSAYGGKQIFFQEKNGMIYDRYKAEYITFEEAVYRIARMVGDEGDA